MSNHSQSQYRTEAGALMPPALRYHNWINQALHRGHCPLNATLLVLGSFYQRIYGL